ncbi:alanine racemase [Naumannella halotolerans]|uniref:Alanine racemase n=1 Tax=Naumannella halotolerans TaxID=993414 RepID=A0A4R7JA86_9ACTN|nr:alanine racemase [Naumannella halotolerans]TDT34234.1 alanine racemase [Naumannella halotolerans]
MTAAPVPSERTTAAGLIDPRTASAVIDLDALRHNVAAIRALVAPAETMVVVKADAYGHGMTTVAAALRQAGVAWLGVATPQEALALREAGDTGRILAWIYGEQTDLTPFVVADIDLTVHRRSQLDRVAEAASLHRPARVQLKIDTGLHRNGSPAEEWASLCAAARELERSGRIEVVGIWSHLASGELPGDRSIAAQTEEFEQALAIADRAGLRPTYRHLANTGGALGTPGIRYDLVRLGIGAYGIDPADGELASSVGVELRPAMRLRAQLIAVKPLRAGESVSYGLTWTADRDTTIGLVPLGYADGIPVAGSDRIQVRVGDRIVPQRGRVCMDQFIVDLGPQAKERPGDEVTLFGDPAGPRAEDWARQIGTIGYEIVTRIGLRVPRVSLDR